MTNDLSQPADGVLKSDLSYSLSLEIGVRVAQVAEELPASVVVLGTHGRSGLRRAVMGSTSDHVVRHAACPVLVQQQQDDAS